MKFLLELVSCCTTSPRTPPPPPTTPRPPPLDETKYCIVPSTPPESRHGRRVVSKRSRVVSWRPSLHAVSENKVVVERPSDSVVPKRKVSPTTTRGTVHVRKYSEDCRRVALPTIIPTFSPTPFLF